MKFFGIRGNNFSFGFQSGTDHLTRGLPIWSNIINKIYGLTTQEVWETVNNNEYKLFSTTPEIYIPVMKKANMFSNGRFVLKNWNTNEPIENHPLISLLEKPTPLMNRNEWLIAVSVLHDIYGNCYLYINQPSKLTETPNTLSILPNDDLKLKLTGVKFKQSAEEEIIKEYVLETNKETFEPSEIIHFKNFSIDGIKGQSILESLQMPVSNARGAYGFNNVNITKRGALGILSPTKGGDALGMFTIDETAQKEIEKQFVNDNGIFDGQSPIKISKVPVDYTQMSLGIKDQMIFETINQTMQKVIDAVGLNANIFSQEKGATFNNADAFLKSAYQDCIIPFAEKFCFSLTDKLKPTSNGERCYIELDYSHLPCMQVNETQVAQEMKMKAEAIDRLVQVGYTIQEAETLLGITRP